MIDNKDKFFKYPRNDNGQVDGTSYAYKSTIHPGINTQRASGSDQIGSEMKNLAVGSTNISIYSNGMKIGFVQSFSPSEQRTITPIQELGTEGVVQMVAGNTNGGQISLSRFAIYNSSLFTALGITPDGKNTIVNPFKTLKDQRVPLEIKVTTAVDTNKNGIVYDTEVYVDCWLTNYSKSISSQTITINETCTISYSDVVYIPGDR